MASRRFGFTMSDRLHEDIKKAAAERGVSMSEVMREAIREWVLEPDAGTSPASRGSARG